jgi:hypothetical protein
MSGPRALRQPQIAYVVQPLTTNTSRASSLIVAAPWIDPCSVLDALLPLLIPSGAFVLYSPTLQPLTLAMEKLRKERAAVGLKLVEPWFREHQVLQLGLRLSFGLRGSRLTAHGEARRQPV